jgi:hypothetical protein
MRYNDDLPLSRRRAETELSMWRKRALKETRLKPNVIQRMSLTDLKAEVALSAGNDEPEVEPAEGFERYVSATEAVSLLFSGDYDHLTAKQFREKFPWFGIEEGD